MDIEVKIKQDEIMRLLGGQDMFDRQSRWRTFLHNARQALTRAFPSAFVNVYAQQYLHEEYAYGIAVTVDPEYGSAYGEDADAVQRASLDVQRECWYQLFVTLAGMAEI